MTVNFSFLIFEYGMRMVKKKKCSKNNNSAIRNLYTYVCIVGTMDKTILC